MGMVWGIPLSLILNRFSNLNFWLTVWAAILVFSDSGDWYLSFADEGEDDDEDERQRDQEGQLLLRLALKV